MPDSTSLGIPYPLGGEAPYGAIALGQLAQQVNALIVADRGRLSVNEARLAVVERVRLVGQSTNASIQTSGGTTSPSAASVTIPGIRADRDYRVDFGGDLKSTVETTPTLAYIRFTATQGTTSEISRVRGGAEGGFDNQLVSLQRSVPWRPATGGSWTVSVDVTRLGTSTGGARLSSALIVVYDVGPRSNPAIPGYLP